MKPYELLNQSLNKRVIVSVRGDREYRGILDGYDMPHMNIMLRDVEEVENVGKPDEKHINHRFTIIRGENIIYISP